MSSYEDKAERYYGEVCVNKGLVRKAGLSARSLPMYVGEWIVSRYAATGSLDEEARQRMRDFINQH